VTQRVLSLLGLGAALGAAATVLGTGITPPRTPLLGPVLGPPAAVADELPAIDDCAQVRRWYVDRALPHVTAWGFDGGPVTMLYDRLGVAGTVPVARDTAAAPAVGSSDTGTNVQETGVDEPDLAKTDGRTVVRVAGRDLVVTDVTGVPRELARLRLPGRPMAGAELLLAEDTVLVVGQESYGFHGPVARDLVGDRIMPAYPQDSSTRLITVDVADPATPRVTSDQRVDGSLVSARLYADGTVRVALTSGYPALDFVRPGRDRSRREARAQNRRIVEAATLDQWLPGIGDTGADGERPLLDCTEVRHPRRPAGFGTISVLTFPATDPTALAATAVTAAGDLVYSSATRLYVATRFGVRRGTEVHAFSAAGPTTRYLASGRVPGQVRDRWSFSEYDGRLRVAIALGPDWSPRENGIVVLDEAGDRLRVVGRVDGLGRGEQIQSVRWLGELAVMVTFRQTDPLYTIDLSDPAGPRVLGALKIRGFSSYLHPLGGDRLLGLGQDATRDGQTLGAQAAVFDLGDLAAVSRTDTLGFGAGTDLVAGWEPRAFSYLPERGLVLTPLGDWSRGRNRLLALHVSADGSLHEVGSWPLRRWSAELVRALPLPGGRVALVDHGVRVLDLDRT
jgi:hypothetical protein